MGRLIAHRGTARSTEAHGSKTPAQAGRRSGAHPNSRPWPTRSGMSQMNLAT